MTVNNPEQTEIKDGVREAVGVFHEVDAFEAAIAALFGAGFNRTNIGLLANATAVEEKLGHKIKQVSDLEDDQTVPRATFIEPESIIEAETIAIGGLAYIGVVAAAGVMIATGGTLGLTLIDAAIGGGTGGVIGSVIAGLIGKHHSNHIEGQLKKGGLLLWISLSDNDHEQRALKILNEHNADHVHVHVIPRNRIPEGNPFTGVTIDPFLPEAQI